MKHHLLQCFRVDTAAKGGITAVYTGSTFETVLSLSPHSSGMGYNLTFG